MERHTWEWTRLQIHVMETLPFLFKVGWLGSFTLYIFTAKEFTVVPVMIQMCTWIDSYLGEIWKQFLFLFLATIRIYWFHPVDECGMGWTLQMMEVEWDPKVSDNAWAWAIPGKTPILQSVNVSGFLFPLSLTLAGGLMMQGSVLRRYWSNVLRKYWSNVLRKYW
jgi:hypothetical protein